MAKRLKGVPFNDIFVFLECPHRWQTVLLLVFMVVLAGILMLGYKEQQQTSFRSVCKNIVANLQQCHTLFGPHNFRWPNRIITEYDDDVSARLATLVERRATVADPDLIRLIVDMLDPPNYRMVKMSPCVISCTPQCLEVEHILKEKVKMRSAQINVLCII